MVTRSANVMFGADETLLLNGTASPELMDRPIPFVIGSFGDEEGDIDDEDEDDFDDDDFDEDEIEEEDIEEEEDDEDFDLDEDLSDPAFDDDDDDEEEAYFDDDF